MAAAAVIVALLLTHPTPSAWKHVSVTRTAGGVTATLAYDTRPDFATPDLRAVTLDVRRGSANSRYALKAFLGNGAPLLRLRNVWGDRKPEVVVSISACDNRCADLLYVVIPETRKLLRYEFDAVNGEIGWDGEVYRGRFEFIGDDGRFFCVFSDCASSSMPVLVLAVDTAGDRFVDVSRDRPDLLLADAKEQWSSYEQERREPPPNYDNWLGAFMPWCADEYRLGARARSDARGRCARLVPAKIRSQIAAWGYR